MTASKPPAVPVRVARKFAIAGEIGWNSLAGLGVNGTYNFVRKMSLDVGLGLSAVGYKGGVRIRGNLLESEWTPVLGVGYLLGAGTFGKTAKVELEGDTARFRIRRSHYIQGVIGANYTGEGGFTFMGTLGYAWLLRENCEFVSGTESVLDNVKPQIHGGVALATSFGYAF